MADQEKARILSKSTRLFTFLGCAVIAFYAYPLHAQLKPNWQVDWEATLAAAKKEGRLVVHGASEVSLLFEEAFQRAYPEIKVVTVSAGRGTVRIQRIMAERRAGMFNVDLYVGSPRDVSATFLQANIISPIQPLLVLPEVTDESKWWKGRHHYADPENRYIFIYEGAPQGGGVNYNKNLVDPKKLQSFWDLLDPKWKGKIVSIDPAVSGPHEQNLRFFYYHAAIGPEFVRRLYAEMDIRLSRDDRQTLDWLAVGKYVFALFPRGASRAIKEGLPIAEAPPGHFREGAFTDPFTGVVSYMNRAPHPNAAKVAVNWLLSREGQIAFQNYKAQEGCDSCESLREDIPKDRLVHRRRADIHYMITTRPEYIDMTPIRRLIAKALEKPR